MRDTKETKQPASEGQKTLHEDGPVTNIFMSMGAEVGPRAKAIAEAAAYRTEGSSSKGASGEMETASTGAHVKAGCKKAESNEDTSEEECGAAAEGHTSEENRWFCCRFSSRGIEFVSWYSNPSRGI